MAVWTILLAGFGLWFLLEGAVYALAPGSAKRFLDWAARLPMDAIRNAGLWTAILGAILIYGALRLS